MLYQTNKCWAVEKRPMMVIEGTEKEIDDLIDRFYYWVPRENLKSGCEIVKERIDHFSSTQGFYDKMDEMAANRYKKTIMGQIYSRYLK